MSSFSDKYRAKAKEQRAAATVIVQGAEIHKDVVKQVAAVVAMCDANIMDAIADLADHLDDRKPIDPDAALRDAILKRNDAIRQAASVAAITGDWSEFNKLVKGTA